MISTLKKTLKLIMPNSFIGLIQSYCLERELKKTFRYDYKRYKKYSAYNGFTDQIKLEGILIRSYHVIEKGLTMPETRLGFGQSKVLDLCNYCEKYIRNYDYKSSQQFKHALGILKEYQIFHQRHNYELPANIHSGINNLLHLANEESILPDEQTKITKEEYFKQIDNAFPLFSNSRKSVRNYTSEEIPEQSLKSALSLALNAPSACNRQAAHMYVFSAPKMIKKILDLQGGTRGFGHLSNKLVVVTAELGVFNSPRERNQAFTDGGIFSMNLLYSLHANSIAGCILNCNFPPDKDKKLRRICGIADHEVFVTMISCGIPPKEFLLATSLRYKLEDRCKFL